jgi:hypothetical protein
MISKNKYIITFLLIIVFMACSLIALTAENESTSSSFFRMDTAISKVPDSLIIGNLLGFTMIPDAVLFPHFQADPAYPRFKLLITETQYSSLMYTDDKPVGGSKYLLSMGGKKSFFRLFPAARPDLGLQIEIGFGFNSMVDLKRGTDFIGWDGVMHLAASLRPARWLALQAGRYHVSSHRADEFLENSGGIYLRNYVRDSYGWAIMLLPTEEFRLYAKFDEAFFQRPNVIRDFPNKVQVGFEFDGRGLLGGVWTFAGDFQFFEENNWEGSYNFQLARYLGPVKKEGGVRLGVEYYMGRVPIADFFEQKESYISVGIWVDSPAVY